MDFPPQAVMVIDFLQRGDLERFLLQFPGRRFPEHIARFYAAEIVLALKHLHSRGIVHRDLKVRSTLKFMIFCFLMCISYFSGIKHSGGRRRSYPPG